MPRSKYRATYTPDVVKRAIGSITVDGMSVRKASKTYNIPKTTLIDKLACRSPVTAVALGKTPFLTQAEEARISLWAQHMAQIGYGQIKRELKQAVQRILLSEGRPHPFKDSLPGKKWYKLFLGRHPDLARLMPQHLGGEKASPNQDDIHVWFEQFGSYLKQRSAASVLKQPERIYHLDECGFPLCDKTDKVLSLERRKTINPYSSRYVNGITLLSTISAAGAFLPPTLVCPHNKLKESPLEGGPAEAYHGKSKNGWLDDQVFYTFIEKSFLPYLTHRGVGRPVILFVDAQASHLTPEVTDLCNDSEVILYCLPAHASNILQPCDLAVCRPLQMAWEEAEKGFITNGESVKKLTLARALKPVWDSIISRPDLAKNAFKATGIFPFTKKYNLENLVFASLLTRDHSQQSTHIRSEAESYGNHNKKRRMIKKEKS